MIFTNKDRLKENLKDISNWEIPETEKTRLKKYIEDYKNGDVTGRMCKDKNLDRVIDFLRPFLQFLNKDITKLKTEDTNKFFIALPTLKNKNGQPYKTGPRILSTAKKYLEHHAIDNKIIKPLKKKLNQDKISKEVLTPEFVEEELVNKSSENWKKYFHEVLFWGGFRISEFLGLRRSDIMLPREKNENFVKIKVRRENTKSDAGERVVVLFGKNCNKIVQEYLLERQAEGMGSEDYVCDKNYDLIKSWLYRLSQKLKVPLHSHLYRHSSATYLSRKIFKGNIIKICDFFGWEYNSPVPKTYIRRKTLIRGEEDEVEQELSKTTIEEFETKIEQMESEKNIQMEQMQKNFEDLNAKMISLMAMKSVEVFGK